MQNITLDKEIMTCSDGRCNSKVEYICPNCGSCYCAKCAKLCDYKCDCQKPIELKNIDDFNKGETYLW